MKKITGLLFSVALFLASVGFSVINSTPVAADAYYYKNTTNGQMNTYTDTSYNTMYNSGYNSNMYNTGYRTAYNYNNGYYSTPNIVHAKPPVVQTADWMYNLNTGQNTGVVVTAQNMSPMSHSTMICAMDSTNTGTYNVGCIPRVDFSDASQGASTLEFHAWPTTMNGPHRMFFTYLDSQGQWRTMTSPTYQQQTTSLYAQ